MVLQHNIEIPSDGIRLEIANTHLFIENNDYGNGKLYVAESNLIWRLENGDGLCLDYPHIALHAVSSDLNAFPQECLYVMLDNNILKETSMEEDGDEENNSNDDEEGECTELRFVPQDKTTLNHLFLAMNDCQALHPDDMSDSEAEEEEEEEEDDDDEGYTDVPDLQIIGRGQAIYQRPSDDAEHSNTENGVKNGNHYTDADQFEDAD